MPKRNEEPCEDSTDVRHEDFDPDVTKLLELKRKYKHDVDALETELIMRHQQEEEERKASIRAEYLEKLAVMFAERIKPLLAEVLKD